MNVPDNQIQLSIVIPAYNASKCIIGTLTSLVNQTVSCQQYRIIVVDDGSKDDTLALCQAFAEKHPNIVVVHQENAGVSSARNLGLSLAVGKWVTFVDSDDYVNDHYVELLLNTEPEADWLIFCYLLEQGGTISQTREWIYPYHQQYVDLSLVRHWVCDNLLNSPWDKRYLLSIVNDRGIRFKNGVNFAEDLLFNFQYSMYVTKTYVTKQTVYVYRENAVGLCHQKISAKRFREYEAIYEEMQALCLQHQLDAFCLSTIHLAFLRNIARCAGQLHTAGYSRKEITDLLRHSPMVRNMLAEPSNDLKNRIRKFLLKAQMYRVCSMLFQFRSA